jgi:hypothetical protein
MRDHSSASALRSELDMLLGPIVVGSCEDARSGDPRVGVSRAGRNAVAFLWFKCQ